MKPSLDRLLIVEESSTLALNFAAVLANRAKLVRTARSSELACRMLRLVRPDLVLIDLSLPGAFEVLRRMQQIDPLPWVVAISSGATTEQRFRLAQLGVRTCISKPVTVEALEAALDWALLRPSNFISYAA